MKNRRKKILIVDDHPMIRVGLADFINQQSDIEVCAEAGDCSETFRKLARIKPDLLLTDIGLPDCGAVEFIEDLKVRFPDLPILVISMHDERIYAEPLLRCGVRGYIMKEAGAESLLAAIRQVLSGQMYVSPSFSAQVLQSLGSRKARGAESLIGGLTPREGEVFHKIGQGKSTAEISKELKLSPKTVGVHCRHMREKLGLKDMSGLVHYAVRWVEAKS